MKNSLARPLAETVAPVFALDPRRTIVFCNAALTQWLAVEAGELLGQRCDYATGPLDSPRDLALASLAAPPEVFAGSQAAGIITRVEPEGTTERRRVRYAVLPQRGEAWVVGVVDPVPLADEETPAATVPAGQDLHHELLALRAQIRRPYHCDRLLGESPIARCVREQVRIAIDSRARTCVVGPAGSGREHVARTIHGESQDSAAHTLLPLACSLLDPELLDAAVQAFVRQTRAGDGEPTVLLLEVDQLTSDNQLSLARLLASLRRPVRTLSTARRPLTEMVAEDLFRADLAAWLSPLVIELPPLAARRQDLPLLAQLALEDYNAEAEQPLSGFQAETLDALAAYHWPENFDELHAVVAQACRQAAGPLVALRDLPEAVRRAAEPVRAERTAEPIELDKFLADTEREVIARALRHSKGNKALAARLLGIPRVRLLRRIEQLGVT